MSARSLSPEVPAEQTLSIHRPPGEHGHQRDTLRTRMFREEFRHFLGIPPIRLMVPSFVTLAAGVAIGVGHAGNLTIVFLLVLGALYSADRHALATRLGRDVAQPLTRHRMHWWRRRLAMHLALHGCVWAVAIALMLPRLPESLVLLFLCVTVANLGVVCSMMPAPANGLRAMCLFISVAGMCTTLVIDLDIGLKQPIILCGAIGLIAHELLIQRNVRLIRGRLYDLLRMELLRAKLVQKNRLLDELSHSKTLLLATVSHDLRQPVHALALLTERLGADPTPDAATQRFATIRSTSDYLLELLSKLMTFSRIELGKQAVALETVDAGPLLWDTTTTLREVAAAKGLRLECRIEDRLFIQTDPALLRRVLHNLLDNAVKYTAVGGVHCSMAAHGAQMEITISDSGPGIPADVIGNLGRPHMRSAAAANGGLGLGLGVVHGLCPLIGVSLHISAAAGSGTRVTLTSPLVVTRSQPAHLSPAMESDVEGLRVLLVDNHPVILGEMAQLLRTMGFTVSAFESAVEALQFGRTEHLDLVVSDMHLDSELNGLDLVDALRQVPSRQDLPAMVITGDIGLTIPDSPRASGIAVIHKPASPDKVRRAVRLLAARRRVTPRGAGGGLNSQGAGRPGPG